MLIKGIYIFIANGIPIYSQVKLAEDIVARGNLTPLSNQVLPTLLHPPPQHNTTSLPRMAHASPSINVHGHEASYAAMALGAQNSAFGLGSLDMIDNNFNTGVISDNVSCVTDDHMWAP